jgi:predicted nuclease of predicted toxin-antitoxin system
LIRLLLDQGLPRSTVDFLLGAEWDVVHACQCGLATASDEQILQYARANGRVICTLDADFHALLAVAGASGPSVVRIRREGMRVVLGLVPRQSPARPIRARRDQRG